MNALNKSLARDLFAFGVGLIVVLAAVYGYRFWKEKRAEEARTEFCRNNQAIIDGVKAQWASEKQKKTTDEPTMKELLEYMMSGREPKCPSGGIYFIRTVGELPNCSIHGELLKNITTLH